MLNFLYIRLLTYFIYIRFYLVFKYLFSVCVCICVHVHDGEQHAMVPTWRSEDSWVEFVLSFHL